ncbi:3-oxoacyl-ACP synthase III family protein [Amycolatopsis thermoflava]|uniref:3-oxoacyl-ACP synthase III family protein n=1 Tax=Amycolatopsis thermoflava TaxID=84480 RepID=UPI0036568702
MNTAILGTGSYLPETVVTSAELGRRIGVDEDWILRKTGIRERRLAAPDEATSDLAAYAAQEALVSAGMTAADLDLIIVATSTPDQPIPSTACFVQSALGASRAAAFDVDAVCTGFMYAFVSAHAMLLAGQGPQTALVIGADTYSRILDYGDRRTSVLFGDGAGAVVLGKVADGRGLLASTLGSEVGTTDLVRIPAGGSRRPASHATVESGGHYFAMEGREVRNLAGAVLPDVANQVLKTAEIEIGDIDLVVPHQANGVMLAELEESLSLKEGVMHKTVARYGNTGAASVPVTLHDAILAGRITRDDLVLMVAFGGGMTWGGALMRWPQGGRILGRAA